MIKAQKSAFFSKALHLYNTNWLLKRSFSSISIKGAFKKEGAGVLILVNHSSWWDGLVTFYLTQTSCPYDSYAMMSEKGLMEFPFFKRIGAFSVNVEKPRSIVETLVYAKELLHNQKAVWMFPQGAEQPLEKRPLEFKTGSAHLATADHNVTVYTVTYYYTMLHEQKPRLYIDISEPVLSHQFNNQSRQDVTTLLESRMTLQLNQQRDKIAQEDTSDYTLLLSGNRSVSDWFNTLSGSKS
ncbi:lysophospholipid acyltransferase family protein [Alkalicoccobacillus gibsonii]|uniref:lysophospholipid acyltransferase family protein n=1 Tax=Alkalicoccobacillus gibsonii TaxID=79881 RepID=UPI003F7C170C